MSAITIAVLLLLGIMLFVQGRKHAQSKQGRLLRRAALALLIVAVILAVIDALDLVEDRAASDPAAPAPAPAIAADR